MIGQLILTILFSQLFYSKETIANVVSNKSQQFMIKLINETVIIKNVNNSKLDNYNVNNLDNKQINLLNFKNIDKQQFINKNLINQSDLKHSDFYKDAQLYLDNNQTENGQNSSFNNLNSNTLDKISLNNNSLIDHLLINKTKTDYFNYILTPDQLTIDLIFDDNNTNDNQELFDNEKQIINELLINVNRNNLNYTYDKLIDHSIENIDQQQSNYTLNDNYGINSNELNYYIELNDTNLQQHYEKQYQNNQQYSASLLHQPNHLDLDTDYLLIDESINKFSNNTLNITNLLNQTHLNQTQLEPEKGYLGTLLIVLPPIAVFGNLLVIIAVFKEKTLRSVTNYFIVSLAFADLLVAGVVMPFAVYYLVNVDWELSELLCDFWMSVDVLASTASIFNLVAISIDRYIAITQPIKYAKHKSNKRVAFTIAFVWILSFVISSPIWLGWNTSEEKISGVCIFVNSDFIIYSSLGSFYIPCCLMIFLYFRIFKEIRKRAKRSNAKSSTTVSSGHQQRQTAIADTTQTQSKQTDPLNKPNTEHKLNYDKLTKPTIDTTSSQQESNSDELQTKQDQQIKTSGGLARKFHIPLVGNKTKQQQQQTSKVTVNITKSEIDEEDEEEDSELTGSDQQQTGQKSLADQIPPSTEQKPNVDKKSTDTKGFYFRKIIHSDKNNNNLTNQKIDKNVKKGGISAIIKSTKGGSCDRTSKQNEDALIIANVSALNSNNQEGVQLSSSAYSLSASTTSKARRLIGRFALSSKLKSDDEQASLDYLHSSSGNLQLKTLDSSKITSSQSKESLRISTIEEPCEEEISSEMVGDNECKIINNYYTIDDSKLKVPTSTKQIKQTILTRSMTVPLESNGICVDCGQLCAHSKTYDQDLNKKDQAKINQLSCIVDIVADFTHENNEVEILMENINQKQKLLPDRSKSPFNELVDEENVEILANRGARLTDPDDNKMTCTCDHQLIEKEEKQDKKDLNKLDSTNKHINEKAIVKLTTQQSITQTKETIVQATTQTTTFTSTITTSTITGSSSSNSVKPISQVNTNGYLSNKNIQDEFQSSYDNTTTMLTKQDKTQAIRSTDQLSKKKSRFNLGRKQKNSRKKREKASAKRERKATKTLAIVLGVFLFCWVPFFSLNIYDAICIKLHAEDCKLGVSAFLFASWVGYFNSCLNPLIYTIFNTEFRKAFKKILHIK